MLPVILGALAGAGALYVASEISAKKDEEATGGKFVAAELDIKGIQKKLDTYFWQASKLYQRCNELCVKSSDMMFGSIDLPDDNALTKIGNKLYDAMTPVSRAALLSQLKDINNESHKLLGKYAEVFIRANEFLKDSGNAPIFVNKRHIDTDLLLVNNTMKNEDWGSDFENQADKVRDFIEASYETAQKLIDALATLDSNDAETSGYLGPLCATPDWDSRFRTSGGATQ